MCSSQDEIYDIGTEIILLQKMAVTQRRKHPNQEFLAGSGAFFEILHLAVSKRDL